MMQPSAFFISFITGVILAYLIGSISFAVIVSKIMGLQDPRTHGSGNPGATNVLRTGNKGAALLTLLGDGFKGWIAIWVAQFLLGVPPAGSWNLMALIILAVFLGHLYPIFLNFKGGKGVATALGILCGIHPLLGLATTLTWLILILFFRYVSLASIVAAIFAPLYYLLGANVVWPVFTPITFSLFTLSLLLIWRHQPNIERLIAGQEAQLGHKDQV